MIRECPNSKTDIEKLFIKDTQTCQIKFLCLYDYSYAVINLKLDEDSQLDCSLEHIKQYALTRPVKKKDGTEEKVPEDTKDQPR